MVPGCSELRSLLTFLFPFLAWVIVVPDCPFLPPRAALLRGTGIMETAFIQGVLVQGMAVHYLILFLAEPLTFFVWMADSRQC